MTSFRFGPTLSLAGFLALASVPALAHTGGHGGTGFSAGLLHPLGGPDHVLAMVTVGLLAASLGGRALWAVPTTFVAMMLAGSVLGFSGVELPAAEAGILGSVVAVGLALASGLRWKASAAALVGAFAVFHGYAHGAERPDGAGILLYCVGFAAGTALLHGVGLGLGAGALRGRAARRLAGGAGALAGLVLAIA